MAAFITSFILASKPSYTAYAVSLHLSRAVLMQARLGSKRARDASPSVENGLLIGGSACDFLRFPHYFLLMISTLSALLKSFCPRRSPHHLAPPFRSHLDRCLARGDGGSDAVRAALLAYLLQVSNVLCRLSAVYLLLYTLLSTLSCILFTFSSFLSSMCCLLSVV